MAKMYLITLTSPLAVRLSDGGTKLANVFEATFPQVVNRRTGTRWIRIHRVFDSKAEAMLSVGAPIDIQVKETNLRSSQEVR